MKRDELVQIVNRAAMSLGYELHTGEAHKINGTLRSYPAAWLLPPIVKSKKGRAECEIVYRVVLHLLALPYSEALSENRRNADAVRVRLEEDAARMCAFIADDMAVYAVSGVSFTSANGALTPHGEISMTVEADITMWYYI